MVGCFQNGLGFLSRRVQVPSICGWLLPEWFLRTRDLRYWVLGPSGIWVYIYIYIYMHIYTNMYVCTYLYIHTLPIYLISSGIGYLNPLGRVFL